MPLTTPFPQTGMLEWGPPTIEWAEDVRQMLNTLEQGIAGSGGAIVTQANLSTVPMNGTTAADSQLQAVLDSGAKYFRFPQGAVIALNNPIAFPSGVAIEANGVTFKMLRAVGAFAVRINSDTRVVGDLTIDSKAGDTAGFELVGSNIRVVGSLHALCATGVGGATSGAMAGSFGGLKTGITVRDGLFGNVHIDRMAVTGFDFAAIIARVQGIKVDELQIRRYRRGLFLDDPKHVWINGGLISEASVYAKPDPGHNGVILEATAHDAVEDIHFGNLVVRDAGEHGWRLGGAYRIRKVWFNECSAINVGRGGFKVLGGAPEANNWHEDIFFNNVLVEDAGQQEMNAGGIMIGYAKRVQINSPIIRASGTGKTYSSGYGIHIIGSFDVTTTSPYIKDALEAAYCVEYTKGDQTNISLNGGQLHSYKDAIKIDWTQAGTDFRFISIEGFPILGVTGDGYMVNLIESGTLGGTTGTLYNTSHLSWQSGAAANRQITGNGSYRVMADVRALFDPAAVLRNGSTWVDINTGQRRIMTVGAWTLQ